LPKLAGDAEKGLKGTFEVTGAVYHTHQMPDQPYDNTFRLYFMFHINLKSNKLYRIISLDKNFELISK